MFGSLYAHLDRALKDGRLAGMGRDRPALPEQQLEYSRELLADVLNRCTYVQLAAVAAKHDRDKLADLQLVLLTFETDIEEARLRARRAGLLREDPIGWMTAKDGTEFNAALEEETGDDLLVPENIPDDRREEETATGATP